MRTPTAIAGNLRLWWKVGKVYPTGPRPPAIYVAGGDRRGALGCAHGSRNGWAEIVGLYDLLLKVTPTPVVELNRAVAVAMSDGPARGLALVDEIRRRGELEDYYLAHSARADLCKRLGKTSEAVNSYRRALSLARQEPARRFIVQRLQELGVTIDEPAPGKDSTLLEEPPPS